MTNTKLVRTMNTLKTRSTSALVGSVRLRASAAAIVLLAAGTASAQGPATAAPAPAPAAAPAAQDPNCPPGSWFCGDAKAGAGTQGAAGSSGLQPLPGTQAAGTPPAAAGGVIYSGQAPAAPPVVIYQPAPPVVVVQAKDAPPPYRYTARQPVRRSEWGVNLHLEGAFIGGKSESTGMGGGGVGLRFRPAPIAALEADLDFVGGRDYNGNRRNETAFALNCLLFVNPKSKTQVYFLAGFGWAGAHVSDDSRDRDLNYGYFGGQAGVGMEFRLAKHFALNADFRGFVRSRTDSGARYNPEFRDGSRTTNSSGGGLLTAGMTFYF